MDSLGVMRSQRLRYVLVAVIAVASGYLLFKWAYPPPPTSARYLGVYEPGIDGYFEQPSDTYASVFGSAVVAVQSYASKPILLSEVGVGPGTGHEPQDIAAVFNGIREQRLLGSVWFDVDQHGSPVHQDWHLEGDQAALAAFRQGASGMKLVRTAG